MRIYMLTRRYTNLHGAAWARHGSTEQGGAGQCGAVNRTAQHLCSCVHAHTHVRTCAQICFHTCPHACLCACLCAHLYAGIAGASLLPGAPTDELPPPLDYTLDRWARHAYRHAHRHVHRHAYRHVYRHVCGHVYKKEHGHVDRHAYRHLCTLCTSMCINWFYYG